MKSGQGKALFGSKRHEQREEKGNLTYTGPSACHFPSKEINPEHLSVQPDSVIYQNDPFTFFWSC
jgi:hypothetical protein